MKYTQLISADDWYFKHDDTVWNVAAFALTDGGDVIGLVGAGDDGLLKPVPTKINGVYLHRRQLTDVEAAAADKKR